MDTRTAAATSRFSERLLRLLERTEHRVARTPAEREAAFRLRYEAYLRNGLLEPRADGQMYDEGYDDGPSAWITTTYIDGELAGTARVNVSSDGDAVLPCFNVYPDVVAPPLRAGRVIVEITRLAAQLTLSSALPELAYVAVRPAYLAARHFNADFAVATPRGEHMAFYRRVFQFAPWCEPRDYPGLSAKFGCMGMDFQGSRERVEERYPIYRSTSAEREALFGPVDAAFGAKARARHDRSQFEIALRA
jgi:N-acyl amino acid synthase FeeM